MRTAMRLVLLACVAVVGLSGPLLGQTVTARVGGDLTGLPNTTVAVPIVVDMSASGGAKLGSYTARLTWDTTALDFCAYCSTDSLRGNFPAPQINADSAAYGVLRLTAISPLGVDGLVTVAVLPFNTGIDTLSTPMQLGFSEMSAAGTFTSLLPMLTVSGGTYCPARGRWGDLDGDGSSGSRDALMILSSVVGLPLDSTKVHVSLGDVDGDGRVTSRDALIILSYAVGIAVPGERVLLLAPSSCGTGSARQLAVFPSAASLIVNQPLQLTTQATDSARRGVTVTGTSWSSSNYAVAGVDASGIVTPRAPGMTTITAVFGPGVQASATITVLARRPNWYVSTQAIGAPLELGDAAHPFEQPSQAYALASEGDTIRVATGTYLVSTDGELKVGVVLLGGTPGDTTTRPTLLDPSNSNAALWLEGGARTLVRNVTFQNFDEVVDLDGGRSVALEDVKILLPAGSSGYGIYDCSSRPVDSVRVERSALLGDSSTLSGNPIYYEGCGGPVVLTEIRNSTIRFWAEGLELYEADSVDVAGSQISDNDGYGIFLDQEDTVKPALHVTHSRLERNYYQTIAGYDYRRVVVDSTVIRATEDDALNVNGYSSAQPMELYLHGDSIYMEANANDYNWLYADYADTAAMDRSVVRFPADTSGFYTYGSVYGDNLAVTNSKFLNLSNADDLLYFGGRQFLADSVSMTGCRVAGCDQSYGFDVNTAGAGASATVRRSQFSQIYEPINLYASGGPVYVQNVAIDSAAYGIEEFGLDSVAAVGNVLTRIENQGIYLSSADGTPRRGSAVAADSVTCSANPSNQLGTYVSYRQVTARDNVVLACTQAIATYGALAGTALLHNTLRGSAYGINVTQYDASVVTQIDSNAISASDTGVVVYGVAELTGNNIGGNSGNGLDLPLVTLHVHQVHGNAFVGNARYAVVSRGDSVDATGNWWGNAAGPGRGVADSVFGGRIGTTPFLTSLPSGLPALAQPALVASRAVAAGARPLPATSVPVLPHQARAARAPRGGVPAVAPHPGASPRRVARIQQIAQRRATHAAADAVRGQQVAARRAAQRAQVESRHQAAQRQVQRQ